MNELRKNHVLNIKNKNGLEIKGIVLDFEADRVMVKINSDYLEIAKKFFELDDTVVTAQTHFGLKTMCSSIISSLDNKNCIIIENSPTDNVNQKRENVRVNFEFNFSIVRNLEYIKAKSQNISAGGIAFSCGNINFDIDEQIEIILPFEEFQKNIKINAQIIKKLSNNSFVAKFLNLNLYDENKIVKRIFELLSKK